MALFARELLKEATADTTVNDWICDANNGFFRYYGALMHHLGIQSPKGAAYSIPYYTNKTNSIVIRFPGVGALSIIGFNIGLYGAVCFSKLYAKKQQKSLSYLSLSNLFFAGMNISALIYHCVLPTDHKMRYLFRYFDQVCTGIAGVFLGFALQSMGNKADEKTIKDRQKELAVVASCVALPLIHPFFGDTVYIGGLLFSLYSVLKCYLNTDDETNNDIRDMHRALMSCSVISGIGLLADKQIASYTKRIVNIMQILFLMSDLGYMASTFYMVCDIIRRQFIKANVKKMLKCCCSKQQLND